MNLPNKLTVLRVIMVPFFVFFMLTGVGGAANKWIALIIFCVASLTDMLDGKIARARNLVTNFGKFMDPLADKLLVCSAMICMIPLGKLQAWFVIVIIAREFIISGCVGWCAPQQGACKLTLNVKDGIIEEALVETIGCSGMTHSAAMASEILPGKTILEALNTDLVCDAINTAMRELFLQIVYGRTQSAFSEDGLAIGAGLEDLGKGLRSQVGTMYGTLAKRSSLP